jgi:hypothetical protein
MLRWKSKADSISKGQKVLFAEKRKERPHGVMQQETSGPLGQVGNWVLQLFFCPRVEIFAWTDVEGEVSLWHEQMFLGKEKGRNPPHTIIDTFWKFADLPHATLQVPPQ